MMIFSFLGIIGCFFPWFSEKMISFSALTHLQIFGYSIVICFLSVLYIGLREHFQNSSTLFNIPNPYLLFIFLFISLYTIILETVVLYHLLIYTEDSQVEWGIMITFIAIGMAILGLIISWDYIPKIKKEEIKPFPKTISKETITLKPESSFHHFHE